MIFHLLLYFSVYVSLMYPSFHYRITLDNVYKIIRTIQFNNPSLVYYLQLSFVLDSCVSTFNCLLYYIQLNFGFDHSINFFYYATDFIWFTLNEIHYLIPLGNACKIIRTIQFNNSILVLSATEIWS